MSQEKLNRGGWLRLGFATLLTLFVWTITLPWVAECPVVRRRIERLDRKGIDPSAMFYTDLPAMENILKQVSEINENHPGLFWRREAIDAQPLGHLSLVREN